MMTKDELIEIEKHIVDFKDNSAKVLCEHDNERVSNAIRVTCKKCETVARYENNMQKPVYAFNAECPLCSNVRKIVTVNLQEN